MSTTTFMFGSTIASSGGENLPSSVMRLDCEPVLAVVRGSKCECGVVGIGFGLGPPGVSQILRNQEMHFLDASSSFGTQVKWDTESYVLCGRSVVYQSSVTAGGRPWP